MKNHQINILLVDDEIYALHLLEELLKKRSHIGKIEKATRKVQALELAYSLQPDIIFQDIRMGSESGLDMVDEYRKLNLTAEVVFITAYEQYAIEAIRKSAFDYLLKPVDPDELDTLLLRLRAKMVRKNQDRPIAEDKLKIPTRNGFFIVNYKKIVYCKAEGNYTEIIMDDGSTVFTSINLGKLEDLLNSSDFVRVKRSVMINTAFVVEVNKGKRTCRLMASGTEFNFSVTAAKMKDLDARFL
jgi:two-component system, LytTR family, response regulator